MNWETGIDIYTIPCETDPSGKLLHSTGSSVRCSVMTQRDGMGRREVQEDVDICPHIADSHGCMAEINTRL